MKKLFAVCLVSCLISCGGEKEDSSSVKNNSANANQSTLADLNDSSSLLSNGYFIVNQIDSLSLSHITNWNVKESEPNFVTAEEVQNIKDYLAELFEVEVQFLEFLSNKNGTFAIGRILDSNDHLVREFALDEMGLIYGKGCSDKDFKSEVIEVPGCKNFNFNVTITNKKYCTKKIVSYFVLGNPGSSECGGTIYFTD